MVAGNFDADQFMAVAAFHGVGNYLLLPMESFALHFARGGGVFNAGVEVAFALQTLPNIAFAFLEKIGIHRAFLVNRDQSLYVTIGKFGAADFDLDASTLGDIERKVHGVLCGVVSAAPHRSAAAQVPFFNKKFSNAAGSVLNLGAGNFATGLHAQAGGNFGVGELSVIDQMNGADAGAETRLNIDPHIHLVFGGMRAQFRADFRGVQTLFLEPGLQAVSSLVERLPPEFVSERDLHGGGSGGLGRRRFQSQHDHLVEKQVLANDKIHADATVNSFRNGLNVGVIPGAIERFQAGSNLPAIQRLSSFHGDGGSSGVQDFSVRSDHANGGHRPRSLVSRRLLHRRFL